MDLGCGNGTQTRYLVNHFARGMCTEITPSAVETARTKNAAPSISYRVLDALCSDDVQVLREEIGNTNLYTRAVLHQLSPADHATAIQRIKRLNPLCPTDHRVWTAPWLCAGLPASDYAGHGE